MPGRHLSHDERRLSELWANPPTDLYRPYLESITVSGGLRGINGLLLPFRYPISALCGKNGVGKSTVLALAALAYHSPSGWQIPNWLYQPQAREATKSYYTFRDFFLRGAGDQSFDGVSVTWTYRSASPREPVRFKKSPRRWGSYSRRPEREVAFIPVSRMLTAHEISGIRSTFAEKPAEVAFSQLPDEAVKQLGHVMGTEYTQAEIHETRRHTFQRAHANATYTGFNMGGGESWVMNLLHTLHTMPRAGLLVIEEVEAGLHPEAQKRLAEVLVNFCLNRHTQIVCSTHSETFIDALPRQARILLRKSGDDHEALESPSTRFAISEMTGETRPELTVYCEDQSAKLLIEESLPHQLRSRCVIREVGGKATVIRQGVSHLRSGYEMSAVCIMDGDCAEGEISGWITSESAGLKIHQPEYLILPGGLPPERWVSEQLRFEAYRNYFAEQFQCSARDTDALIESFRSEIDHHNLGYSLSQRTGIEPMDCIRRTMRAVAPRHPQLDDLRGLVKRILD